MLFKIILAKKIKAASPSAAIKKFQGDDHNSSMHKSRERQHRPDEREFLCFEGSLKTLSLHFKSPINCC